MEHQKEKRNSLPSEVRLKSIADVIEELDNRNLNAIEDAIIENRNSIAIHNIDYIIQKHHLTQAAMCKQLNDSPKSTQISNYRKIGTDIPFRTIARIGAAYGYTPEQMYSQLLDQNNEEIRTAMKLLHRTNDEYQKYVGTYHMAYFRNDAKLGNNKRTTDRSLSFGVLTIYPDSTANNSSRLLVAALTNCVDNDTRVNLVHRLKDAIACKNFRSILPLYEKIATLHPDCGTYFYQGELILTERITEITLRQTQGMDVVHMQMLNRAANSSSGKQYQGGLAAMLSTSRGEEHMPCVQTALLSRRGFEGIQKESVAEELRMGIVNIELKDSACDILHYAMNLLGNPILSERDKQFLLESYIEKHLTEKIRSNVLSYFKISAEMDSHVYKTLCR